MINQTDLKTICINTAVKLFDLPNKVIFSTASIFSSKMILPKISSSGERVSEQEARFMFIREIDNYYKNIFYSVETPTKNKYSFTGKKNILNAKGESARFDLSLYSDNDLFNIEFKAKNVDVETDLLKLLVEKGDGVFFHLLESIGSKTLSVNNSQTGVLIKYKSALNKIEKNNTVNIKKIKQTKEYIIFFICCLKSHCVLMKKITKKDLFEKNDVFYFDYEIKDGNIKVKDLNSWDIIRF